MFGGQSRWRTIVAIAVAVALTTAIGSLVIEIARSQNTPAGGKPVNRAEFAPRTVVRPFPPIVNAPVIDASKVSMQVSDNELVLGVVIEGEARAYPINMLTGPSREIINDTLGGREIAATW